MAPRVPSIRPRLVHLPAAELRDLQRTVARGPVGLDGVNRAQVAGFVRSRAGLSDGEAGLKESSSFVEVPSDRAETAAEAAGGSSFGGGIVKAGIAPRKAKYFERAK